MTKQEISEKINSLQITDEFKAQLFERVNLYPETLEQTHLDDFDAFLSEVILQQNQATHAFQAAAVKVNDLLAEDQMVYDKKMAQLENDAEEVMSDLDALQTSVTV